MFLFCHCFQPLIVVTLFTSQNSNDETYFNSGNFLQFVVTHSIIKADDSLWKCNSSTPNVYCLVGVDTGYFRHQFTDYTLFFKIKTTRKFIGFNVNFRAFLSIDVYLFFVYEPKFGIFHRAHPKI